MFYCIGILTTTEYSWHKTNGQANIALNKHSVGVICVNGTSPYSSRSAASGSVCVVDLALLAGTLAAAVMVLM